MARDPANSVNVLLLIRDHVPELINDLHRERERLIGKLLDVNQRIALAETVQQVAPAEPQPEAAA